jgi:hypothetical protein
VLYEAPIFTSLRLRSDELPTTGADRRPHAGGYLIGRDGSLTDSTPWTAGKGADGAIVTNAIEEATFAEAAVTTAALVVRSATPCHSSIGHPVALDVVLVEGPAETRTLGQY